MTHFILDSSCHPYVRKRIKETGISHTEITDWDFEVMQRDGRNLNHYKRACHIKDKKEIAAVIAPYFKKSAKQIQVSLFHMKLVIRIMFPFWIWSKESDYNSDWRICQSRIRSASSFYSKRNQSGGCRNL